MIFKKVNLLDMSYRELCAFFIDLGEEPFRAHQVMQWIYGNYCDDFNQMTNLSKSLRLKLNKIAEISAPMILDEKISLDKTMKWSMKVDNQKIETVCIPDDIRSTLCISSQVGCPLGCKFCDTGRQGFSRNLRVSEIVGQLWRINKLISYRNKINKTNNTLITHVVLMGMGEPLLNLNNVVSALKIVLNHFAFGLSKKRVVLSTAGIVPGIDKLKEMIDIPLAVSLHAPNDVIRNKIMPINKRYNINSLLDSIGHYLRSSKIHQKRVTIEYVLLDHVNDEISHAYQLIKLLRRIPCKVNLIPWNPILGSEYICSSNVRINAFLKVLLQHGIVTIIRKVRGADIGAACGQLIGEVVNRTNCVNNISFDYNNIVSN